jgi:capsular exopolysaccharide synthesis family protein
VGIPPQEQVTLLTDYDKNSAYSQAYQTLYTNIRFNWDDKAEQQHSILLTTPAEYAGRAAAPANIAIAAAQNGTQTILIDADLQAPSLQQRFGLGEQRGLNELLMESAITPQKIAPYLQKTFIPNLALLCAGSTSQSAQDTNRQLASRLQTIVAGLYELLKSSESHAGLIIFNSPPVLTSLDATLISTCVEQTFLLIATGRTTRVQARKAQEQLERVHAKLAGLIMLDV